MLKMILMLMFLKTFNYNDFSKKINVFFCFELSINFLKFADDFADGMGGVNLNMTVT